MKILAKLFAAASLLLVNVSTSVSASAVDVQDIVKRANLAAVYPGNDGRAEARMLIVDKQGRKQMRQFTILRRNIEAGGDQQFLVVFSRPSDVARTTFLVDKHPGGDDDRWLYLPGLDLLKRIASGDKRTSFVGSTFFYEDISGRDINADNFELLSEDDSAWTLKAIPKDAASVEFAYYTVKIDKKTMLPMLSDYFDSAGKNYRRMSATKVKDIQGFPTIMEMKAENLRDGSFSINQLRKAQYDVNIPENVFSERSLRMPPRAWVKL